MINFVLERFRDDENLRAFYAETYQYIMLDEYQDTNNPQNEIIDLILSYSSLCPADISLDERDKNSSPSSRGIPAKQEGEFSPNIMVV